jgi:hypothetical protein
VLSPSSRTSTATDDPHPSASSPYDLSIHTLDQSVIHTFSISPSNTAKLSSPLLLPRTISYDGSSNPPRRGDAYRNMSEEKTGRRRRSSSLLYQEPPESIEHMSDQAALPNLNANWVNAKGQSTRSSGVRGVTGVRVVYIVRCH